MAGSQPSLDAARKLGSAEAASFDLFDALVLDAIVTGRIAGGDAFDACGDAVRVAEALGKGPRMASLCELQRQLGEG